MYHFFNSWHYSNKLVTLHAYHKLTDDKTGHTDGHTDILTDPNFNLIKNVVMKFVLAIAISVYPVLAMSRISGIRLSMYPAEP